MSCSSHKARNFFQYSGAGTCDPFAVDGCGVSAVTLACADETTPTELMDAFIDAAGEDANKRMRFVDACCRFGRLDALRRFARRGVGIDSSPVRRRFAMATFRYGMEVDLWREAWATGAHAAAFVGRRDFFRNASAFADARDDVGRTPLMYAIDGRQSVEFIEFMIREMGADVDASADEPYGSTLRHACRARRADVENVRWHRPYGKRFHGKIKSLMDALVEGGVGLT